MKLEQSDGKVRCDSPSVSQAWDIINLSEIGGMAVVGFREKNRSENGVSE